MVDHIYSTQRITDSKLVAMKLAFRNYLLEEKFDVSRELNTEIHHELFDRYIEMTRCRNLLVELDNEGIHLDEKAIECEKEINNLKGQLLESERASTVLAWWHLHGGGNKMIIIDNPRDWVTINQGFSNRYSLRQ